MKGRKRREGRPKTPDPFTRVYEPVREAHITLGTGVTNPLEQALKSVKKKATAENKDTFARDGDES